MLLRGSEKGFIVSWDVFPKGSTGSLRERLLLQGQFSCSASVTERFYPNPQTTPTALAYSQQETSTVIDMPIRVRPSGAGDGPVSAATGVTPAWPNTRTRI